MEPQKPHGKPAEGRRCPWPQRPPRRPASWSRKAKSILEVVAVVGFGCDSGHDFIPLVGVGRDGGRSAGRPSPRLGTWGTTAAGSAWSFRALPAWTLLSAIRCMCSLPSVLGTAGTLDRVEDTVGVDEALEPALLTRARSLGL